MNNYLISIIILAAAYLSVPRAVQCQSDSDLVWKVNPKPDYYFSRIDFSPDGNYLLASMADFDNTRNGIYYLSLENGIMKDSIIGVGQIAGFSNDGKYFYTYFPNDNHKFLINMINLETKSIEKTTNFPVEVDSGSISKIGILPDGRLVATISYGLYLYFIIDGNSLKIIDKINHPNNSKSVVDMCLSPFGDYMVLYQNFESLNPHGPPTAYAKIILWDINKKAEIKTILPNNITDFFSWKFFPDGIRLGISTWGKFKILNIYNLDSTIINNTVNEFVVSKNQEILYLGFYDNSIKALNNMTYEIQCVSKLYPGTTAHNIIMTIDEDHIIATYGGILMNIRNCYHTTDVKGDNIDPISMIYPNPGKETFTYVNQVLMNTSYSYQIINNTGQVLIKKELLLLEGKGTFSVKNIPSGSYRFKLYAKDKVYSLPFIIER